MSTENTETMFVDRTGWDPGPWDDEPDKLNWKTKVGLPGMIVRGPHGALCGYVAVTEGHPCFGLDYTSSHPKGPDGKPDYLAERVPNPVDDLNVHGGITYGQACMGRICHVPEPGDPDNVWWLGFDCSHYLDIAPGSVAFEKKNGINFGVDYRASYRTVHYVRAEVELLAEQLANMEAP